MINKAIQFATKAHDGQFRKATKIPYILHPLEAAAIVSGIKSDEELIAAAVLHDILEETEYTIEDITEQFGKRVAELVASDTEDKSKTWEERKSNTIDYLAKVKDKDILIVTLGDKLSNIRSIYNDYYRLGDEVWKRFNKGKEDQGWYYNSLASSMKALNGIPAFEEYKRLVKEVFG